MSARGTPALQTLAAAGVAFVVHEYELGEARHGERHAYGREAALALGVDPARMFKTLVATVDGEFVAAVVPVAGELDPKALAAAMGGRRAGLADPAEAERATGSVVGGISPLGGRRRLPTAIDASVVDQPTVLVSAGRRGLQVELAPADLVRLTTAIVAPIARR